MDLTDNSPCIIGYACRLPGVSDASNLFDFLNTGDWHLASRPAPSSRGFDLFDDPTRSADSPFRGGWLGEQGVEQFDPDFFRIPRSEADTLRPNVRLALELTWEALEHAGIPPSTLRGKNISVSFGVGTEDGWDLRRFRQDGVDVFDEKWAASSDPSGVAGRVSHFFDFRGTPSTASNACASGGFSLRDGILSLLHDEAEVAIVGSVATHFTPSPFRWAETSGVASATGRSSSFSLDADGYSPSEGAVVLVLKRYNAAKDAGDVVHGKIRALATAHNGATRTMFTPSAREQAALLSRTLKAANLAPEDINICEAHGTGTAVGDAIEAESIRSVFGSRNGNPLLLSSAKTMLGHCHGSAALVGILKIVSCFAHRALPPHGVQPAPDFLKGPVVIPTALTPLSHSPITALVNSAGFTGSIFSAILESESSTNSTCLQVEDTYICFLPFSHQEPSLLDKQMQSVVDWAKRTQCSLLQLAAILGLCREHHGHRKAVLARTLDDVIYRGRFESETPLGPEPSAALADPRITSKILGGEYPAPNDVEKPLLEEICRVYESGKPLDFSAVYDKHAIDHTLLSSFPFYVFNRRRCWREVEVEGEVDLRPVQQTPKQATISFRNPTLGDKEEEFRNLIDRYGAPISGVPFTSASKATLTSPSHSCILLTGANGALGVRLLNLLLQYSHVTICCPIRGNGWERLETACASLGLDLQLLRTARKRGNLRIFPITDICAPQFGLSQQDYVWISQEVDQIVHAAWNVNFNTPLSEFHGLLRCTRSLAELCFTSSKRVRYFFIGTHASTFGFDGKLVPERILNPCRADALEQGYAIAKLIAEHALLSISKSARDIFDLAIVRVGQICGDTVHGAWSANELVPMLISSLPTLRMLPAEAPEVAWIPSDVCASILRDFIMSPRTAKREPLILHVANPIVSRWTDVAQEIACIAAIADFKLVSMHTYVKAIKAQLAKARSSLPVARLLPFFESVANTATKQRFTPLEITHSRRYSAALNTCRPVGGELLRTIVLHFLRPAAISHSGHVFVFGPAAARAELVSPTEATMQYIVETVRSAGEELGEDHLLDRQLRTLGMQVDIIEDMYARGIEPLAVVGYCFGEYAAAVAAGIITFSAAIEILIRRARAIRGVDGALLNVFTDIDTLTRVLSPLPHPAAIAIIAGPAHIVLTGLLEDVQAAESAFGQVGIKTIFVAGQIPFHSALMTDPARSLQLPQLDQLARRDVHFVSGIAGVVLPPERVTASYWKRHMCVRVDFYRAMCTVRAAAPEAQIINIGPGDMISRMLERYGGEWQGIKAVRPEDASKIGTMESIKMEPTCMAAEESSTVTRKSEALDPKSVALTLLAEILGHEPSDMLLSRSLHSLGMQSLDFVRFSEQLMAKTGLHVPMSTYVTDVLLGDILLGT